MADRARNGNSPSLRVGGLVAALVVVLVAGVGWFARDLAQSGAAPVTYGEPPVTEWESQWLPYVEFVQETRGLEFDRPVTIERVDIASSLADETADGGDPDTTWLDPYVAFGLADSSLDFEAEYSSFESNFVLAYYDTETQTVYIPDGELTLVVQSSLVHELTHALQDQHSMIDSASSWSDGYFGHRALVEGDADWVERRWEAQLSAADARQIASEYEEMEAEMLAAPPMAPFVENYVGSAYALGDPAVEIIRERGGQAELDRLLLEGPGSTEFLLDPLGVALGPLLMNRQVVVPDYADSSEKWSDSFGALDLYNSLASTVGPENALAAVVGYDDDRYTPFTHNGTTCVASVVWTDSSADAEELSGFLTQAGASDVTVGEFGKPAGPGVSFVSCEGSSIGDPGAQTLKQQYPLVLLNWLVYEHLVLGSSVEVAQCAATAQANALVGQEFPDWDTLVADSAAYVDTCRAD